MTKRELIDRITALNPTAGPEFLARFENADLAQYLQHLQWLKPPDLGVYRPVKAEAAGRNDDSPFATIEETATREAAAATLLA